MIGNNILISRGVLRHGVFMPIFTKQAPGGSLSKTVKDQIRKLYSITEEKPEDYVEGEEMPAVMKL